MTDKEYEKLMRDYQNDCRNLSLDEFRDLWTTEFKPVEIKTITILDHLGERTISYNEFLKMGFRIL